MNLDYNLLHWVYRIEWVSMKELVAPVVQLVSLETFSRWDVSSNPGAVTRTGIFPLTKINKYVNKKNAQQVENDHNSLVHEIRVHGRRGKGTAESVSREKS